MTDNYSNLLEQHQVMQAQLASQPDSLSTEDILTFLEAARAAGATMPDVRQREQLRAILRHWGGIIFDRQGDYPATQLAPFAGPPVGQAIDTTQKFKRPARRWLWILGSIVILFICALSFLIRSNFFFAFEPVVTPTATGDLTRPAIELTSVVIEITGTPTPPPTATRRDEQNEGEASDDPEDSDGDGLSDEEEAIYGTNPYLEDSDFDGIDDFTEIFVLAIEPLNFDTDGDGLWDGEDDDPLQAATATSAPIVTSLPDITATPQTAVPHTVQTGETLALIAEQYGISMGQLAAINGLAAEDSLQVGQQLLIPLKANVLVLELVVKVPAVDLYSGPGDEYEVVAQLPRGTFATILGQTFDPAWYLVKVQDRSATQGWLSAAVVRLLYPTQPEMIPLVTPPSLP